MRYALPDDDRNGFCPNTVGSDKQSHHTGLGIQWAHLIENKIPDAVVNAMSTVLLNGLQRMGMVTYHAVGASTDDAMNLHALTVSGL